MDVKILWKVVKRICRLAIDIQKENEQAVRLICFFEKNCLLFGICNWFELRLAYANCLIVILCVLTMKALDWNWTFHLNCEYEKIPID